MMSSLHWLRPEWLWGLLAVPVVAWLAWRLRNGRDPWAGVIDPVLRPHVLDQGSAIARGSWSPLWAAALVTCGVLALAGPSWHRSEAPLLQSKSPLVIAIDLSSTSLADDVAPSRLLLMRAKLQQWLKTRPDGQVALVAFARDAYTVAPLTDDPANVAVFIDALAPDVMPDDGQNADRAIGLARDLLQQSGNTQGDIVVMTDHADAAAIRMAGAARSDGFRVSALGVGNAIGRPVRDGNGDVSMARLDLASLTAMAAAGGGRAATMQATTVDIAQLGADAPTVGDSVGNARGHAGSQWQDDGAWLLLPLILLLLPAFRRGGALAAMLVIGFALAPQSGHAGDLWRRPDQQAYDHMESAQRAYRKGDFARAEAEYTKVHSAEADYNRGNALARLERYREAVQAYDDALMRNPGMADAKANREAVLKAMRQPAGGQQSGKNKQQGNQQGNQQQNGQQSQANQQQGDSQQNRSQQNSRQQGGQQQGGQQQDNSQQRNQQQRNDQQNGQLSANGQSANPKPEDRAGQQAADAAQRERMREALKQGRDARGQRPGGGTQQETPAERERQQQVDAWLRRIPDDPGALLRSKFQIERGRRRGGGE
ncbi:VWA domain-containing protein [Solilutibacter silvestris]|uniref:von Willebrand factor type A domain-containing protein n=1 Tax=Solilutibacter silvestris TaxID=1645665 RepID=A0A2K1PX46_9GAMM|nr:VWA domain-containing protein [Lysobacter silvestris]PNS07356.1 von Willebrand factor type A domain-containing protein [Lysobacter silvestris]